MWVGIANVVEIVGLRERSGNKQMKGGQRVGQGSRRSNGSVGVRWRGSG